MVVASDCGCLGANFTSAPYRSGRETFGQHLDDLLAVEAPVLDEDRTSIASGHAAAGEEEIRDVRFVRLGIEVRHEADRIAVDPGADHEIGVRLIPREEEYGVRRQ